MILSFAGVHRVEVGFSVPAGANEKTVRETCRWHVSGTACRFRGLHARCPSGQSGYSLTAFI